MTAAPAPLVRFEGVTRRFGPIVANDGITLDIAAGTIHGLVGENGAGKSTLMRQLYGLDRPDSGRILIEGRPVRLDSPRHALALGIGMVHQHFMLVPTLPVLDNILLGDEPGGWVVDRAAARRRLEERAGPAARGIDLDRPVGELPIGLQQRVEILKLLYRDVRLLILDEPTAVLTPTESEALFAELARLRGAGRTIILITHRLAEVIGHTDRITILRRGRLVRTARTAEVTLDTLAAEIVGEHGATTGSGPAGPHKAPEDEFVTREVLALHSVSTSAPHHRGMLHDLTLTLHSHQLTALIGVEGNGQSDLARIAAGRLRPQSGSVVRNGVPSLDLRPPRSVGYIPEDRLKDAVVADFSAADNLILGRQDEARFQRRGVLDRSAIAAHAGRLLRASDVRPPEPDRPLRAFSGGNQQKLVLARETEADPKLLVAVHPTRGLDLTATRRVHETLQAHRDRGAAVLLVTAEIDEARRLADRLLVIFDGRIVGDGPPARFSDADLGRLMTGGAAEVRG